MTPHVQLLRPLFGERPGQWFALLPNHRDYPGVRNCRSGITWWLRIATVQSHFSEPTHRECARCDK